MKHVSTHHHASAATLQHVLDQISAKPDLTASRRRDLRSAVIAFGKLADKPLASIPLDLSELRRVLDHSEGSAPRISPKRRANLRSDLTAAIDASGTLPLLRTGELEVDDAWRALFDPLTDQGIRNGLSRFSRWCSLNRISPDAVTILAVDRYVKDLEGRSLVRNIGEQGRTVVSTWNRLSARSPGLPLLAATAKASTPARVPLETLPGSFLADLERFCLWSSVPDPLDDNARATRLAPATVRLRREQIHSAVTAAVAAGIEPQRLRSLGDLVDGATFTAIMRRLYQDDGSVLTPYTHGVAGTLIAVAKEWTEATAEEIGALKKLRRRLGVLPSGLTKKNKAFLRRLEDAQLLNSLILLPVKLWQTGRRGLAESKKSFIDIQTSLAIDLLLVCPLRMQNLASLNFRDHLHWPNGRGKPAMLIIEGTETKNGIPIEAEVPAELADRLWTYRTEIAPTVTGKRPDVLFVATTGRPRTQSAITVAIEKAVFRHVGIRLTPHQFRHLAAKVVLDANPGAHELVRQLLVHKNIKTTTNYYAGMNTLRAGRAHADLLARLKEQSAVPKRRRLKSTGNSAP